ncbi:hypothetical protein [Nocardioides sp. SYSU D00065]|uniref:hypothetical protein n=1 Tax=Nocardioides sp. SYSU D00065 TaxID=2817378 RepID=UPI001B3306CE|nr:hypothetical protein [Nocardioides sp. SYSU D00065]
MPTDWERDLHDLVAEIRAVCTSLADPTSGMAQNASVGISAYARSPRVALGIMASMSALRIERRNEILLAQGRAGGFPRAELDAALPERYPGSRRSDPDEDCLDFLEAYVAAPVPDVELVQALADTHGLVAYMRMAHINNLVGQLLVDVDGSFATLHDLMAAEALTDETEYMLWED